jgi:hypothetical protein
VEFGTRLDIWLDWLGLALRGAVLEARDTEVHVLLWLGVDSVAGLRTSISRKFSGGP